jgi:DNA-binding response OmpR family regulator
MMPGKYGTEILTEIRKKSNAIELPIIMTTAKAAPADLVSALRLGANDYITKPINFEVALSRVRTHLRLADLSRDMARLQEIATLHAMVVTYNHEINNPLAIALSCVEGLNQRNLEDSASKLKSALWRVAEIVKKIQEVSDSPIEYAEYARGQTMIRLKK